MRIKIFIASLVLIINFSFAETRGNLGRERLVDMLELPAYSNGKYKEQFAVRYRYSVSFNSKYRIPNWVAWKQTKEHYNKSNNSGRQKVFDSDEELDGCPTYGQYNQQFTHGFYHRGHLCPHEGSTWEVKAARSVDCMSNISPQTPLINNGIWKRLEGKCKEWSDNNFKELYIVSGPILNSIYDYISFPDNSVPIGVPKEYFKAILGIDKNGEYYAIGYIVNNITGKTQYTTIDKIEELTGYNLFHNLSKNNKSHIENKIEAEIKEDKWPDLSINGKCTRLW